MRKPVPVMDHRICDAPQLASKVEWYYLQAHLREPGSPTVVDPRHTVVVCLFRMAKDTGPDSPPAHDWAVIYMTLDWVTKEHATYSKLPDSMPEYILGTLEAQSSTLSQSIRAMFDRGSKDNGASSLAPDQPFVSPVKIHESAPGQGPALHLDWDDGASLIGENGSYHLKVPEIELDVQVHATKPLLLHGTDGETSSEKAECCMFYYSWPRTEAAGQYKGNEVEGNAWVDHEYHLEKSGYGNNQAESSYGWNWFSLLTSGANSMEICITQILGVDGITEQYVVYFDELGQRHRDDDFTLIGSKPWISGNTFQTFDTCWRLVIPRLNVDLEVVSVTPNQEFQTWLRTPSFYEGGVHFSGTWDGVPIKGFGLAELVKNNGMPEKFMERTLSNASSLVRTQSEAWIPSTIRPDYFGHLAGALFDNKEEQILQRNIVDAFHILQGRGGKNWRPMLLGAVIGLVGGDANEWCSYFPLVEMVHTASLIIDDVEDDSETRRGGPCVHKVLGVPSTINAGCTLYFWGEIMLHSKNHTDGELVYIYDKFFQVMRAGHFGQALDIDGMSMKTLPSIEEAEAMQARIINLHRCKSGIPASICGSLGAFLGRGSVEQINAATAYVENLGIAFQIRDDVLDVLGKVSGKQAADDLYNHKFTYPVAKLFTLQHPDREKWFGYWEAHDVPALVDALKTSGTIDMCNDDIRRILDEGWEEVHALTPNSFSKVLLRMFAHFLIEQHY
ncbi:isoprenoid synthase domain-containing protein [Aspergillus egyptiacus]|nr:isoprenoid synthase domain-containing protein [Aspergillus egyptiacus]